MAGHKDRGASHAALLLFLFSIFESSTTAFSAYKTVFLQSIGLGADDIGIINAFVYCGMLLCIFLSGVASDHVHSIKNVLAPVFIMTAVLFLFIPTLGGNGAPVLVLAVYFAFAFGLNQTIYSLSDSLNVRMCAERGLNFGAVRSANSFTYAVISVCCVYILKKFGVNATFYIFAVSVIPAVIVLLMLPELNYQAKSRKKLSLKPLLGIKRYWIFIAFMFICYLSMKPYNDLMSVYMEAQNIDTDMYGLIVAVRALFEIPSLLLVTKLRRRIPLQILTAAGFLITAASAIIMGTAHLNLTGMVILLSFAGIGNGLQIGSASNYIYQVAPSELKATAASVLMVASSVAGMLGNLFGGTIMDRVGAMPFYLMLGAIMLFAIVVFVPVDRAINPGHVKVW